MLTYYSARLGLVALLVLPAVADPSITFVATSKENLEPIALDTTELEVQDIHNLLQRTGIYGAKYRPTPISSQELASGSYNHLEDIPDILHVTGSPLDPTTLSSPYGFIGAIATAYFQHSPLVISPDHVWITILSQFGQYFNARAELFRDQIVDFEGKKELIVQAPGTVFTAPYDLMTRAFLDAIAANIKDPSLRDWFLPGFSTTTHTDEVVASATAMCTFQAYFSYEYAITCGIPEVTLLGTQGDWEKLRSKIERLLEFTDGTGDMEDWVDLLRVVLDNFVESRKNGSSTNLNFWDNVMYLSPAFYGGQFLSGWITVFSFFVDGGQRIKDVGFEEFLCTLAGMTDCEFPFPLLRFEDVNPNILTCPAVVQEMDGPTYNATLYVGQLSFNYDEVVRIPNAINPATTEQVMQVSSRNSWALVIDKPAHKTVEVERPLDWEVERTTFGSFVNIPLNTGSFDETCIIGSQLPFSAEVTSTPEPTPAPTQHFTNGGCLSSMSVLEVLNKGVTPISDLKVGDKVLVMSNKFSRIYGFGHSDRNGETIYRKISMENMDLPLEITPDHLVFVIDNNGKTSTVPASVVSAGDQLMLPTGGAVKVTNVTEVNRKGAFAPFTEDGGTLIVNGVVVSSYITLQPGSSSLKIGNVDTLIPMHLLAHIATAPRRVLCRFRWNMCQCESYTDEGIAKWVAGIYAVSGWYLNHDIEVWTAALMGFATFCLLIERRIRHGKK